VIRQPVNNLKSIRIAGLALAVGLGFFLLPAASKASCGDYVMPGKDLVGERSSLHPSQDQDSNHLPKKGPCHGPNCSKGTERIPAAPTTIITPIRDQWLVGLSSFVLCETGPWSLTMWENIGYLVHIPFRLERPPRFLSL
jgi:hypothetical protein